MKLAIFGNKGYLGSQLQSWFSAKAYEVAGFDVPECDVTDSNFWRSFDASEYDGIFFFSGLTGTDRSFDEAEKFLLVNELGLVKLLSKLAPLGANAPKVIFPSTRLVYKGKDEPLVEASEKETKTVYAVNKMACEGYLKAYGNMYGIPYAILRICSPYGSLTGGECSYGTVGFFEKRAKDGNSIVLYGGGTVRRTFTHVKDICEAVQALLLHGEGIYNMGGLNMSLEEAAKLIADKYGVNIESAPWPATALKLESGSTVFDGSRLDMLMEKSKK